MSDIENNYQTRFSQGNDAMYNAKKREQKAKKILSVLNDYYSGKLNTLSVLDIGCSTGIISKFLSIKFDKVTGIDIDEPAINHAQEKYASPRLRFKGGDAMNLNFPDESFDIVICAHVYEHVPDAHQLLAEIRRVLRRDGICYFAATNRLKIIEDHYKIPMLSIIPKSIAHRYLFILGRGKFYYENHQTLWQLRNLVSKFEVIDYTKKIIEEPEKYFATELIKSNTVKQRVVLFILRIAYWFSPTYIWLLKKKE